ncbi:MAG: GNAT family N-acetyltransferase [Puniceicoccales bacterium]|jgi:RimJ/RimL family protein N-acetyltransferase|nr:GNAT family N-acetyltransferase [Puniceicoccales bacterium]
MLDVATDGLRRCPTLASERLLLKPLRKEDLGPIVHWLSDYETVLMLTYAPWPYTETDALQWLAQVDRMCAMDVGCFWGVYLGKTFIGTAGLSLFPEHEKGELHYWLGKRHWGQGYGTEIARRVIAYAFEHIHLNRLEVNHMARNVRSQRVIEKCGFTFEGLMRSYIKRFGAFEDVKFYSLLRGEFMQYKKNE